MNLSRRNFIQLAATIGASLAWGGTAFEPVGLSFVGASLTSPGAMEAHEHKLRKDLPLRPLYLADRSDGARPDWTFNMLLKHGVRSCLEYAKTFDRERYEDQARIPRSGRVRWCSSTAR